MLGGAYQHALLSGDVLGHAVVGAAVRGEGALWVSSAGLAREAVAVSSITLQTEN